MKDKGSAQFTEDYIVKQMQSDWWISKQSQLLFIWTHIYNEITGEYLYDWSDGDENRLDEYGNVMERAEKCWKDFRSGYIAYTKEISAEARQESIRLTNKWIDQLIRFYNLSKRSPQAVKNNEISQMKEQAKIIIKDCKEYNIDYKAKLSKDILKFYGIE